MFYKQPTIQTIEVDTVMAEMTPVEQVIGAPESGDEIDEIMPWEEPEFVEYIALLNRLERELNFDRESIHDRQIDMIYDHATGEFEPVITCLADDSMSHSP